MGYQRVGFRLWVDADADCRDTRDEVLAAESTIRVRGCDISRGRWVSYYDHRTWRKSSDVDIDHLVPLKEAWDSGAKKWNAATRTRYANDLRDPRTLVAVTDNVNQAKSDRDLAQWMPAYSRCKYLKQRTAVKLRWHLSVNPAERRYLIKTAAGCPNGKVTVTKATIHRRATGNSGGSGGGTGGGKGNDPRFDYCYQAVAAGYGPYHQGRDPEYAWYTDGDGDGVVCES